MRHLLVALFAALLVAACARPASTGSASSSERTTPFWASPTPDATAPPSAEELLECAGAPSEMGGLANDFGPLGAGDTPDAAFENFLESPFTIPRSGYVKLFEDETAAVYAYSADDRVKVVVVISTRFAEMTGSRYTIEELRSCDPTEYGAAVDLGEGRTVWAHPDGRILTDIVGPAHCDWQTMRILHLTEDGELVAQYIRDPENVLPRSVLLDTYAEGVDVPTDASSSGYRNRDQELWFTQSDTALYVVDSSGRAERWPKAATTVACA
jgi:hypothetical protein